MSARGTVPAPSPPRSGLRRTHSWSLGVDRRPIRPDPPQGVLTAVNSGSTGNQSAVPGKRNPDEPGVTASRARDSQNGSRQATRSDGAPVPRRGRTTVRSLRDGAPCSWPRSTDPSPRKRFTPSPAPDRSASWPRSTHSASGAGCGASVEPCASSREENPADAVSPPPPW